MIEDHFPNGRPALEEGQGVYLTDRKTVNLAERMKVTACLNPVHSALGPIGVVLGEPLFAHMLNHNPDAMKMAQMVEAEGIAMVEDPKILSPKAFADELFRDRFVNEYLGDTNLRLAVDVSQMVGIRFGETIKAYVAKYGSVFSSSISTKPGSVTRWKRCFGKCSRGPEPCGIRFTGTWGDPYQTPISSRNFLKSLRACRPIFTIFFTLIELTPPWRGLNEIGAKRIFLW